jgi:hypothetical protein
MRLLPTDTLRGEGQGYHKVNELSVMHNNSTSLFALFREPHGRTTFLRLFRSPLMCHRSRLRQHHPRHPPRQASPPGNERDRRKSCTRPRVQNLTFRPLILEDTGFLDANVTALFAHLSKSDQFEESVPEFTTWAARKALDYWYRGVSRHLVAGNAKMFRGMRPDWAGLRGRPSRCPARCSPVASECVPPSV